MPPYFWLKDGRVLGPFTKDELRQQKPYAMDSVRQGDRGPWVFAAQVPGLCPGVDPDAFESVIVGRGCTPVEPDADAALPKAQTAGLPEAENPSGTSAGRRSWLAALAPFVIVALWIVKQFKTAGNGLGDFLLHVGALIVLAYFVVTFVLYLLLIVQLLDRRSSLHQSLQRHDPLYRLVGLYLIGRTIDRHDRRGPFS